MAKKALILDNKVVDVVDTEFEVHSSLTWMDCSNECKAGEWELVDGNLQVIPEPEDTRTYAEKRKAEYDQLNQFEMQFDDKRDSTTTWVDKINEIKGRHPK
jgi:hypothetical protein